MDTNLKYRARQTVKKMDEVLTNYLYFRGDSEDMLVQKKLWWLFNIGGLPFLIVLSLMIADTMGPVVAATNVIFALCMIVPLVVFHFQKTHLERYILFMQIAILVLTTFKVYLMGGLLEAGTPIFIGLTSPLYALATGNRKRALILYFIYLAAMIVSTELQPGTIHNYYLFYSYIGFSLGITIAFVGLYYYTGQLVRMKQQERKRMKELDRLKNNFFTHITHELRTPLTIILGMADQIDENPRGDIQQGLTMIRRNGRKLLDMTNKLLDLSRMEAKMMPVNWVQQDIVAYVKYLVESFHSYAESNGVELSHEISERRLVLDLDEDKLADIVSNLVSNAIKFTPAGGKVSVKMFREEQEGSNLLNLLVIDDGPGISEEYLPKVFERYFQAQRHQDEYTEGSGLGLAVTREMVQLLHGRISVSSELGKGTVFKVVLPISNEAELVSQEAHIGKFTGQEHEDEIAERDMDSDSGTQKDEDHKLNLLVVEDSQDVASYLNSLLSAQYKIENAWNGAEGLKLATQKVPDLIISDVMMPVMNGFTLCQRLKNDIRTSHIPIILLTARNEAAARMEGLKAGADAYLGKPFNKEELLVRMNNLVALRQRLQRSYRDMARDPVTFSRSVERSETSNRVLSNLEQKFMQRVTQVLEDHLDDAEFGISNLCDSLGMSRSQVYRKFSALTDTSVNVFIRNLRLNKARELLRTTDLNVSEVAYDTGFKSPSYFSRVYTQRFGTPPSTERREVFA